MVKSSARTATEFADGCTPPHARHVAIIMDGNGRWAKRHHLPRAMGHQRGVEAVRQLVRGLGPMGLECLTLYAFSSENWKRVWFCSRRAGQSPHNLVARLAPPHGCARRPLQYSLLSWTLLALCSPGRSVFAAFYRH
jgi:hypothetical protein